MPTKALRALLPAIAVAAIALPTAPMPHLRKRSASLEACIDEPSSAARFARDALPRWLSVRTRRPALRAPALHIAVPGLDDERHERRKQAIPHPLCKYSELLHLTDVVVRRPFLVAGAG